MRVHDDTVSNPMLCGTLTARSWITALAIVAAGALPAPAQIPSQQPPAGALTPPTDLMDVHGRVTIHPPTQPLHLGEPSPIDLTLRGPKLVVLGVEQTPTNGYPLDTNQEDGAGFIPLQTRPDGSAYVDVLPVSLGPVHLRLMSQFADGGWEMDETDVTVIAVHSPIRLDHDPPGGFRGSEVLLNLSTGRKGAVYLWATWPGVPHPLTLPGKDVSFTVVQDQGPPVIRFDPSSGEIEALRIGHALVEAHYGGLTNSTCVLVRESEYGSGNCEELNPGGNRIAPTELGADAPGAEGKLPYTATDKRQGRFVADDRVAIAPLHQPLSVASQNPIAMTVRGGTIAHIDCSQDGQPCVPRRNVFSPVPPVSFQQRPDGTASMNVFPLKPGQTEFTFHILFTDGGVALAKIPAEVVPGSVKPRSIGISCGNDSMPNPDLPVRLTLGPASSDGDLWTGACYDGIPGPVVLPAAALSYRVLSQDPQPAIRLDEKTGKVTPVHEGQALVEREYQGLTRFTCVTVGTWTWGTPPDISNCRTLRARYGAPLSPLPPAPPSPKVVGRNAQAGEEYMDHVHAIERATLSPDVKDPFPADDRLTILDHNLTAVLGHPLDLPLRLSRPDVLAVTASQTVTSWFGAQHPPVTQQELAGQHADRIQHTADGAPYVSVFPRQTGTAEFTLHLLFADGGLATRTLRIPVTIPTDGSCHLAMTSGGGGPASPVTTMHLLTKDPDNARPLSPQISCNGSDGVSLNPKDVSFSLKTAGGEPVVHVEPATGTVTVQRLGHALITARYAGLESQTCIVVLANLTTGDPSNCEELRMNANPKSF